MNGWRNCRIGLLALVLVTPHGLAQESAKGATYPHRLTGEELAAHFRGDWSADGTTNRGNRVAIFNNSDGTLGIRQNMTGRASPALAARTIDAEKSQVCLDFGTSDWRTASGCYRLLETEPKAYALRRGNYEIAYRR
jgi:hypothetical protein